MKKIKNLALIAVAAVAMMSCGFNSKVNSMEKACKAGDYEKASNLYEEIGKKYAKDMAKGKIDEEQLDRYMDVLSDCEKGSRDAGKGSLFKADFDLSDIDIEDVKTSGFDSDDDDWDD